MRINVNLATQPYEDAREYLAKWGPLVLLLLIATVGLVWMTVRNVRRSGDINHQLSQMQDNIGALDQEKSDAEKMLALPQNRGTVQKSQYLNSIFARKAFSWTTVFSDMEKLMPPGLHVLSIVPELDPQNQLQVHIVVGGERRDRAIQLVRNLEQTPRFRNVMLRSDVTSQTVPGVGGRNSTLNEGDLIKFDILANYIPAAPQAEKSASATKDSALAEANR